MDMTTALWGLASPYFEILSSAKFWWYTFWILWIHRYLRLIVHTFSHWLYKSKPIPDKPRFTPDDVTVIIPTIHNVFEELRESLESILACRPHQLILVTTVDKHQALEKLVRTLSTPDSVRVLFTSIANKRLQVCEALPKVKTEITIMADDDVTWPCTLLPWILAPFEDPKMGGVGTCQRVRRTSDGSWSTQIFNWLGAAYIERRNFEISATHNIDGGTSCMSGRTGAYRSEILSSHDFLEGFKTERWRDFILNADDDNFVTRWLVSHQWKTWIQYEKECEIETTLENGLKFLFQCSRWARSNWRSNWTSLVLLSLWWGTEGWNMETRQRLFWAQLIFMFAYTKVVKLIGLFRRNPSDIMFLPVSIVFGYFHGLIKLHALLTLNMTSWGSRPDGDANDALRMARRPRRSDSIATPSPRPDDLDRIIGYRMRNVPAILSDKELFGEFERELPTMKAARL
ncbi:polysaccharide synthase [Camillea tinctor]|nr:polysaccharide synthase [Camillea tinctor]